MCDASQDEAVSCWSDPPHILTKLRDLLPFGKVTFAWDFSDFKDQTLEKIAEASLEQLLYWHLADATTVNNYPAETSLLWTKDDYFWFIHVPPNRQEFIRRIQEGDRLRYLERFHLNHDQVQVTFQELRLISREGQHSLVITEGVEFTYKWDSAFWETSLQNNQPLVDPSIFHLPPVQPDDPEILEFAAAAQFREEERNRQVQVPSLPPSSPPTPSTSSVSGWGDTSNQWNSRVPCWCKKEVCDCGYRPDTPPTPPSVVLWAPGQNYLPFRE